MKTGDVLVEVDGRDVTSIDVKQVKEMTKGPPGSPLKLKAQRGGKEYEVVLERSGGTGTSMASISDASSAHGNATGVVGKELTASERGKEGSEAAMALHGEVDKMRASLVTMTEEMGKAREEAKHPLSRGKVASRAMCPPHKLLQHPLSRGRHLERLFFNILSWAKTPWWRTFSRNVKRLMSC